MVEWLPGVTPLVNFLPCRLFSDLQFRSVRPNGWVVCSRGLNFIWLHFIYLRLISIHRIHISLYQIELKKWTRHSSETRRENFLTMSSPWKLKKPITRKDTMATNLKRTGTGSAKERIRINLVKLPVNEWPMLEKSGAKIPKTYLKSV